MSTESTTAEPSIKVTTTPTTTSLRPWIHPHLTHSVNPIKGRQLETSHPIKKGEVLLIDTPYAIIPAVDAAGSALLCSNPQCNRLVSPNTGQSCPNRCLADVIWCNQTCRQTDQRRHEFECAWLSRYATSVRSKRGEYNFGMLWLIVRILARQNTDTLLSDLAEEQEEESNPGFQHGWEAIQSLCGSTETWSHEQVRSWTGLAKKYLGPAALPHGMNAENVLALICKEEANSFGLYPRETGIFHPLPTPPVDRGEQFGAAVYPRASIANHSCCPNIIHKPDGYGRMVFTASRDIEAGEECCISYFDMTQYIDVKDRREHLQTLFRFVCGCPRCAAEEVPGDNDLQWDAFPGMD